MAANKSLRKTNRSTNIKKTKPTTKVTKTIKTNKPNGTKKKAAPPTKTPTKPTPPSISVTDASSPEQILHSSWKFLYCYQFLSLFGSYLKLPAITIESLENALTVAKPTPTFARSQGSFLAEEINNRLVLDNTTNANQINNTPHQLLERTFTVLLKHIQSRQTNTSNWHSHLYDYLLDHDDHDDILLTESKESWTLYDLTVPEKIRVLKSLIDDMEKTNQMMNLRGDITPETLRLVHIGEDSEGWRYYMFDNVRLYRELPLPHKKGMPQLNGADYTFELVCDDTIEEWQACIDRFSAKTRNHNEKALRLEIHEIAPKVIETLEAQLAAKVREQAKLEKLRKLEEMPRKRSRRLEIKEDELTKRRRINEEEQQRIALERQEREDAKKREQEQKRLEQEQMIQTEADLKNYMYELITSKIDEAVARQEEKLSSLSSPADSSTMDDNNGNDSNDNAMSLRKQQRRTSPMIQTTPEIAFLQELRGILRKSAPEEERLEKMRGWATLLDQDNVVIIQKGSNENAPLVIGQGLILEGKGVSGDLTSPLLKNILRVYLSTIPKETNDTGLHVKDIRKKLLLDRYTADERASGLENFIQDLDLLLPYESERIDAVSPQKRAADILVHIFQKS
ncbi:hypothetical protein BDC45DRAFT_603043 [Circinella umbellata]|nr:hypothetical protein BDC45DRAFT_603043 [Circinella umbellata]